MSIRILLFAGAPLGLAATFATADGVPRSWLDLGLTFIATSLLLGGTLARVTHLFTRKVRRSGWTIVLYGLSMSLAGLVVGVAVYALSSWLPHGRWMRIVSPAEPIERFEGPACYDLLQDSLVYARAVSGRLYQYVSKGSGEATWVEADERSVASNDLCRSRHTGTNLTPLKLGHIIARREIYLDGADCGGTMHFLLLDDRTVWQWSTGGCAIGEVLFFAIFVMLILLGSLSVAVVVTLSKPPRAWT